MVVDDRVIASIGSILCLFNWGYFHYHAPCGFGVRIVPLYPPACRKRRLKGGWVLCSLVVTVAAIRLQGPRFKPHPGQKSEMRFLLHAHLCSASGTTTSGTRASPKPGNSPKKVSK